jgi:hypothetical protein
VRNPNYIFDICDSVCCVYFVFPLQLKHIKPYLAITDMLNFVLVLLLVLVTVSILYITGLTS